MFVELYVIVLTEGAIGSPSVPDSKKCLNSGKGQVELICQLGDFSHFACVFDNGTRNSSFVCVKIISCAGEKE